MAESTCFDRAWEAGMFSDIGRLENDGMAVELVPGVD